MAGLTISQERGDLRSPQDDPGELRLILAAAAREVELLGKALAAERDRLAKLLWSALRGTTTVAGQSRPSAEVPKSPAGTYWHRPEVHPPI